MQWQIECHCENEPVNGFEWAWFGKCNDRCAGNSNQICGGSNAMSLHTTPGVNLDGLCIYDYPSPRRVLDEMSITGQTNMSITVCENICKGLLLKIN